MISFDTIHDACRAHVRLLAPRLVPTGRVQGDYWRARVPWRNDKSASLDISLTTSRWWDRGMPGDEGTLVDLVMRLDGCTAVAARDTLAGMLGITESAPRPPARKKPACAACRHAWERPSQSRPYRQVRFCTLYTDALDEPWETRVARRLHKLCGPHGAGWVALDPSTPVA